MLIKYSNSLINNGFTKDFGKIGKTYPIAEEDMLQVIQRKLKEKETSGILAAEFESYKKKREASIKRPLGIKIPAAVKYRAIELNLTYTLAEDIADSEGKILYKAGTTINPLSIKTMTKALCFVDGDNKKQMVWVNKTCGENPLNKIILVSGDYLAVSTEYKKRFYFDQRGYLAQKLGIEAVPAIVRQNGSVLYLEEIPLP